MLAPRSLPVPTFAVLIRPWVAELAIIRRDTEITPGPGWGYDRKPAGARPGTGPWHDMRPGWSITRGTSTRGTSTRRKPAVSGSRIRLKLTKVHDPSQAHLAPGILWHLLAGHSPQPPPQRPTNRQVRPVLHTDHH